MFVWALRIRYEPNVVEIAVPGQLQFTEDHLSSFISGKIHHHRCFFAEKGLEMHSIWNTYLSADGCSTSGSA